MPVNRDIIINCVRNPVEELANPRVLTIAEFLLRADRNQ